ncbi:MAG: leucine-rich repeat domain-containing protein, partial [bacterium]|nr:leucine-rich repeat domain-containing protein [bacterium]
IELLAVIVILAIIALIAVPIIIDIIEDSKKEALKRSAENYLKAVELAIAKENLKGEFNPPSCTIESGITRCDGKTLNVSVDGELPDSGTITLTDGTIVRDPSTSLKYSAGTLTYNENSKLGIKEQTKPALKVVDNIAYYVPAGSNEATIYVYRGDVDYDDPSVGYYPMLEIISGNIEIKSAIEIDGKTYPVTSIGNWAFSDGIFGSNITSVTIPSSITSIGTEAFLRCTNLNNIIILSSEVSIGDGAFNETPWLQSQKASSQNGLVIVNNILLEWENAEGNITIPDGVKSIGGSAFYGNSSITSVEVPSSVTRIGPYAFQGCSSLATININKQNGSIEGAPWGAFSDNPWNSYSATVNWLG